MRQAIAIWLVTKDRRALLKQEVSQKWGKIYQPIEGWVESGESLEGGLKRHIEEELGEKLTGRLHLREIDQTPFFLKSGEPTKRCHFLCLLTDQQLSFVSSSKKFRLVGKEDLSQLKKIGDPTIILENDIVLFKDSYNIFFKILENLNEGESNLTVFYLTK